MFKKILFLIISINVCVAQNKYKSDSLILLLKNNNLSKVEQSSLLENISFYHPRLDSALYYAKESLKISLELNNKVLVAEAYEGIGTIEQKMGNNSQSLAVIFKALAIYEQLNFIDRQAAVLTQIATHYIGEKEYLLAINYLERAYKIYIESDEKLKQALTLINLGETYRLSGNLNKAETTFLEVLDLTKTSNDEVVLGYTSGNLGMVYAAQNKSEQAKTQLNKAIIILSELQDDYSVSIYLAELGLVHKKERNYNLAERKLRQAFTMAENAGLKEQIRDFSKMLVTLYKEQQNFKDALGYQEVYQTYQDSLVNKANIKKTEQIKANYQIKKRETEIEKNRIELEKANVISANRKKTAIGLSIGAFALAILAFLLYKARNKIRFTNKNLTKQKEEISLKEKEKDLLLKELNHRVKNNLQMVSSLLNLQSNSIDDGSARALIATGKNRVEALSLVHRKLYQEGVETKIEVKPYVEELVLNLLHGYALKITPDFNIDTIAIDVDKAIPLALIINELVTNTIKHAYASITNPELKIVIQKNKETLNLEVIDNGKGYSKSDSEKTNSLGLKLITSLVKQLEGTYKTVIKNGTHSVISLNV